MSLEFLRKGSFFFMREEPVNLKRYLPQWLNKSALFSDLQNALSAEHELYRLKLAELAKQFYVETTSDFERWEQLLKIVPAADASDELRRATIRVKRRGGTVMTVENTKRLLADFAPRGEVGIRELGENKLELLIHNGTFWWEELMQALMDQLPAHLTFDFEISRTINHSLFVGIPDLQQGWFSYDQRTRENIAHPLRAVQGNIVGGIQRFDIAGKNIVSRSRLSLFGGMTEIAHGTIRYECENELPDEETLEDFERYLRRRWAEYNQNPVVEHYRHHRHGAENEPVISGDIKRRFHHYQRISLGELTHGRIKYGVDFYDEGEDDEELILDRDFLRLYWAFPYETKDGEQRIHLRTTTILDPRQGITSGEIKALGQIGTAGEIFVWRKDRIATTGIVKAMYVRKKEMKII